MTSRKFFWGFIVLAMIVVVAACSSTGNSSETTSPTPPAEATLGVYQTLTIDAFADILGNRRDDYTVLNVHIPYAGEVEGTDANVPYNDIEALTAALPDKDVPIILYCRSGNMSEQASRTLLELGYTQVWDVPGGMNAWRESGRELAND